MTPAETDYRQCLIPLWSISAILVSGTTSAESTTVLPQIGSGGDGHGLFPINSQNTEAEGALSMLPDQVSSHFFRAICRTTMVPTAALRAVTQYAQNHLPSSKNKTSGSRTSFPACLTADSGVFLSWKYPDPIHYFLECPSWKQLASGKNLPG